MPIALSNINSQAGIDQKAAVVASALDDIAAKVSAQLNMQLKQKLETSTPLPAKEPTDLVVVEAIVQNPFIAATAVRETVIRVSELVAEPLAVAAPADEISHVQQLAAEGHFQAIAYWLNEPLVSQNVYAQVLADEVPGRLKVLVEFEQSPQKERLIRFVCDRLYRLNSDVIEGVHIIARLIGTATTDWEKSVRLPTAAERQNKQSQPAMILKAKETALKNSSTRLVHDSVNTQIDRPSARSQFKFLRAAMICGPAIAALFFGCFTTLILSDRSLFSSNQTAADPNPWHGEATDPDFSAMTEVSFRPASRFQGRTVEAALETIAVIPHSDVVDPADPTVTLLFGGELALKDFVFERSSDVDQLFSEIDTYQRADVSMVGLAEPLANASTSLQEDFHKRTRPQAVQALEAGGIDIVNLASEGSMTHGERGLVETLNNLDRQGIYRVGAGRNQQEAHRPEILEVKGQRIAYLGYNPDALKGAEAEKAGVALINEENRQRITEDIQAIRAEVDWVVVNYRWGDAPETPEAEDAIEPTASDEMPKPLVASMPEDWQKSLAREAIDAGADLVVGYDPQHIQGAEIYRDRPIAYSLGDFTFSSNPLQDYDTAALKVSLRNQQMKVEFLPITIRDSKLQKATGEQGAEILHTIRDASKTFDQPMQFPTVIKAEPHYSPDAAKSNIAKPDMTEPTYEAPPPEHQPSVPLAPIAPALDPIMQESDALFMPKADEAPLNGETPFNETPFSETPFSETPFNETPFNETPFGEALIEADPLEIAPIETAPTHSLEPQSNTHSEDAETYAESMISPLSIVPLNLE